MKRRNFILSLLAGAAAPLGLALLGRLPERWRLHRVLRPPGARPEEEFADLCIGCGQCASVCPNTCIRMLNFERGLDDLATPVIQPRAKACILCMACTQVCPTGALRKLPATQEGMLAVRMGTAVVSEDLCYSFSGRTCGSCYHACPLPGKAMTVGLYEQPKVNSDYCVGCGLCEQACVQMPQAIRVMPRGYQRSSGNGGAS